MGTRLFALPLAHEIARRHAERSDGRWAKIQSVAVEGRTFLAREIVGFRSLAARPSSLRVESTTARRWVIQGFDGNAAPWLSRSDAAGGRAEAMSGNDAEDFRGSADFDGPLVDFERKGFSVDYAGEEVWDGKRASKLLLHDRAGDLFFLWVDLESYEVVRRLAYRMNGDDRVAFETRYLDFRPEGGVLHPRRVETSASGQLIYTMIVDRVATNVPCTPDDFRAPKNAP